MKVYVVTSDFGYDSNNFEGVFSTQEKAEEFVKRFNKQAGGGDYAEWTEEELDKP
jgi:hypothetical protein